MLTKQATYRLACDKCQYSVIIIPQTDIGLVELIHNQGFVIRFNGKETHLCPTCKLKAEKPKY